MSAAHDPVKVLIHGIESKSDILARKNIDGEIRIGRWYVLSIYPVGEDKTA
jgi:hypothetical protein